MIELQITTHSGDVHKVEVESYDAMELSEQINNNEQLVVIIGQNVYSRIDVKQIKKVSETTTGDILISDDTTGESY